VLEELGFGIYQEFRERFKECDKLLLEDSPDEVLVTADL
jgi:hypothetical protein